MAQWARCKSQAHGALVLFRLGDFYEAFHEDAITVSQALDLTLTKRQDVPMCGIPWHSSETYIDRLIQKGYSVAIAEQIQEVKPEGGSDSPGKAILERKIVRILSPGTATSTALLQDHAFHFIAALSEDSKKGIGLALIDMTTGLFYVMEAKTPEEKNQLILTIIKRRPKEIALTKQFIKNNAPILDELESQFTFRKTPLESWFFDSSLAYETLQNHFRVHTLEPFGLSNKPLAVGSGAALLTFIRDTLFHNVSHLKKIEYIETLTSMQLDIATIKSLDLFEAESKRNDAKSLFSILNSTKTPMGARLLRNWLLSPLIDKSQIIARQDIIEAYLTALAKEDEQFFTQLSLYLASVRDIERLIHRIATQTPSPRDLRFLSSCMESVALVKRQLESLSQTTSSIHEDAKGIPPLDAIIALIQKTIVPEPPLRLTDGEVIMRGIDTDLDELKDLKATSEAWLLSYQNRLREELSIKTLKVGFTRAFGYYIEVSRNHSERIPASFIRRQTLTSGERYVTEELVNFEKKILSAEAKIQARESVLFQELLTEIRLFQEDILRASKAIAHIDLISSLAKLSIERKYIRPQIVENSVLEIRGGRHPVAELIGSKAFISNDVSLDSEQTSFALITGPNMGGKSTYIRMAALLVIMTQIGSFIPAQSAKIGIVDRVMSRVGASDDLASGQSTFMVEMTETAHILHTHTPRSLILLDEIGRGTSTYDGLSIAWAVTEFLTLEKTARPRTLFTTHYHELTRLEETCKSIKNMTVAVSETSQGIKFLYKIIPGKADKSYGIHVAQLAGLPQSVVARAEEILSHLEDSSQKELPDIPESISQPSPRARLISQEDLFGLAIQKDDARHKEITQAEKALVFLRSLDLVKISPLECFMKVIKFHDEITKKK